jgi:hypothetical protein
VTGKIVVDSIDDNDKIFGQAVSELAQAALSNDWGGMQRATQDMLYHANGKVEVAKQTLWRLMEHFGSVALPKHCLNCGTLEQDHVGGKCLFDSTSFVECSIRLPAESVRHLCNGKWIDAIKAHRATLNVGLKESKDLIESEEMVHPQWKRR